MTRQMLMSALAAAKVKPSMLTEIDNREAGREAVAIGMGVGVMSAAEFPRDDERFAAITIKDPQLEITEYVSCLAARRSTRTIQEFFRIAESLAQKNADWSGQPRPAGIFRRHS